MRTLITALLLAVWVLASAEGHAAGGPFGIDHRLHYDNSGIWKRGNQKALIYGAVFTVAGGALALGDRSELGDTFWRSADSMAFTLVTVTAMKHVFRRERPSQTDDPGRFFKSSSSASFPSGEVAMVSATVTPFIVRYGDEHPAVYALAVLPAYDAIARMKVRGHWQSDVIVGAAVGTGFGIWAARRDSPFILSFLPGGFRVGFVHHFK